MTQSVRDLMNTGLITCRPEATLGQVAFLLIQHRVHTLIVANPDGDPLGLISDFDLLAGEWLAADADSLAAMRAMTAGELMSSPAQTIEANTAIGQAARRMQEQGLHRLLVTDNGLLVGVISVSDFVASLAASAPGRETVIQVMSRGFVVCLAGTPIQAVARAMVERRSRSVVVVNVTGQPLGVVTGIDLLRFIENGAPQPNVSAVMHPPITIQPSASLQEAAEMMVKHHIHRLLVLNPAQPDGIPLGLISTADIVAEMARPESVWQTS